MASVLIILGCPVPDGQPSNLKITASDLQGIEVVMACTPCVIHQFIAMPDATGCAMQEFELGGDQPPPPEVAAVLPKGSLVLRFTSELCASDWYQSKKLKFGLHVAYLFADTDTWVIENPAGS